MARYKSRYTGAQIDAGIQAARETIPAQLTQIGLNLDEISNKVRDVSVERGSDDEDSIVIKTEEDVVVAEINSTKSDFKNLYSNGKKVLVPADIEGKVDKEEGKGLSTNDFDDSYKEKVDSLPSIESGFQQDDEEEIVGASNDYDGEGTGEKYFSFGQYGIKAKAFYDLEGNPIISSSLNGQTIAWFGTSIPAQGYPQIVGNMLGATVFNESMGSSGARRGSKTTSYYESDPTSDPYRVKGQQWPRPVYGLMMSSSEKADIISKWTEYAPTWIGVYEGEEGAPTNAKPQDINDGQHEQLKATLYDLCYDVRVARHCGISSQYNLGISAARCSDGVARSAGFTHKADIYIIEHAYNDVEGSTFGDNPATDYTTLPTDNYDKNTPIGALNALIKYIYTNNPKAKILLIGHYSTQGNRGEWCKSVIEIVADFWEIPLFKLYDVSGLSNKVIRTNGYWDNSLVWHDSGFSFVKNQDGTFTTNAYVNSMVFGTTTDADVAISRRNITQDANGGAMWDLNKILIELPDGLHPLASSSKNYFARMIANWIISQYRNF